MIKRAILVLYAVVMAAVFQYGFLQWRESGHSLAQAWDVLRQDWLVLITFIDAAQFTLLVLGWLAYDLRRQTLPLWEKLGWFGLTLWLGISGLILYMTLHRRSSK